jgi:hypothetical protein
MSITKKQLTKAYDDHMDTFKRDVLTKIRDPSTTNESLYSFVESYPVFEVKTYKRPKELKKDSEAEIWMVSIVGIQHYVDKDDNVYLVEDYLHYMERGESKISPQPLKRFGKLLRSSETNAITGIQQI